MAFSQKLANIASNLGDSEDIFTTSIFVYHFQYVVPPVFPERLLFQYIYENNIYIVYNSRLSKSTGYISEYRFKDITELGTWFLWKMTSNSTTPIEQPINKMSEAEFDSHFGHFVTNSKSSKIYQFPDPFDYRLWYTKMFS